MNTTTAKEFNKTEPYAVRVGDKVKIGNETRRIAAVVNSTTIILERRNIFRRFLTVFLKIILFWKTKKTIID